MKIARLIALSLALSASAVSYAGCKELAMAIDLSQRTIALEDAIGHTDDSAPRESARRLRIANEIAATQANLMLMQRANCPMPADPIDARGVPYALPAIECAVARMRNDPPDEQVAKCDTAKWKRAGAK